MEFDIDKIMNYFDSKEELLELIEIFETSSASDLQKIEDAIASKNYADLKLYAHNLKGSLAYLFVPELKNLAFELEQDGLNESITHQENLEVLRQNIPELIKLIRA